MVNIWRLCWPAFVLRRIEMGRGDLDGELFDLVGVVISHEQARERLRKLGKYLPTEGTF